jgi:hypothetical protein
VAKPREFASVFADYENFVPLVRNKPESVNNVTNLINSDIKSAQTSWSKGEYKDAINTVSRTWKRLEDSVTVRGTNLTPLVRARLKAWRAVKQLKRQATGDQKVTCTLEEVIKSQRTQSPYHPLYIAYAADLGNILVTTKQDAIVHPGIETLTGNKCYVTRQAYDALLHTFGSKTQSVVEKWNIVRSDNAPGAINWGDS